jgi:DNA topoisomerase-1
MRTDSVNLSTLCIGAARTAVTEMMGEEYVKSRQYTTKSKGAQEAHEAIRPSYIENSEIEGTSQERRLYDLIWKRTIASQMADAEIEKTTANISVSGTGESFVATGEVVKFDGFLKVYNESLMDDVDPAESDGRMLPPLHKGDLLQRKEIPPPNAFPNILHATPRQAWCANWRNWA